MGGRAKEKEAIAPQHKGRGVLCQMAAENFQRQLRKQKGEQDSEGS